jgi:hypothetical protein
VKQNTNHNNKYRLVISLGAFTISLSVFWSVISRVTNIFFLSKQERLIITGLIFLLSLLVFILFLLNKKIPRFILSHIKGRGYSFLLLNILAAIFAAGLLLGSLIPMIRIPTDHNLTIQPLPGKEHTGNVIYIANIIEMIDAPDEGSINADVSDIQITDGNFSISGNEIILEEGAVLTYTSFYSGCVRVIFETSPESGKVLIRFDNTEKIYSLNSGDRNQTEVNLCSRYQLEQLSDKWKLIHISNFVLDIIALSSLFSLIIIPLSSKKVNDLLRPFFTAVSKHSIEIIILSIFIIIQVVIISSYSAEEQPLSAPLIPQFKSSLITKGDFIYNDFDTSLIYILVNQYKFPTLMTIIVDETAYNACDLKSKFFINRWIMLGIKTLPEQIDYPSFQPIIEKSSFTKIAIDQESAGSCKEVWLADGDVNDEYAVLIAENGILYVIPDSLIDMKGMGK